MNLKYLVIGIGVVVVIGVAGVVYLLPSIQTSESVIEVPDEHPVARHQEILEDAEEIENQFVRDWAQLSVSARIIGEDATSGFHYMIYSDDTGIRAVREAWNGGIQNKPTVDYYYFKDEELVMMVSFVGKVTDKQKIAGGSDDGLEIQRKLVFEDSLLIGWIDADDQVHEVHPRWAEFQRVALGNARIFIEDFK